MTREYKHAKSPMISLTEETLENIGFVKNDDPGMIHRPVWRLKIPYYHYQIQVSLGPYPKSNPNCGIVSLYSPEDQGTLLNEEQIEETIKIPASEFPVAWYVDTPERLHTIIVSLTTINL